MKTLKIITMDPFRNTVRTVKLSTKKLKIGRHTIKLVLWAIPRRPRRSPGSSGWPSLGENQPSQVTAGIISRRDLAC